MKRVFCFFVIFMIIFTSFIISAYATDSDLTNTSTISSTAITTSDKIVFSLSATGGDTSTAYYFSIYYKSTSSSSWTTLCSSLQIISHNLFLTEADTYDIQIVATDESGNSSTLNFEVEVSEASASVAEDDTSDTEIFEIFYNLLVDDGIITTTNYYYICHDAYNDVYNAFICDEAFYLSGGATFYDSPTDPHDENYGDCEPYIEYYSSSSYDQSHNGGLLFAYVNIYVFKSINDYSTELTVNMYQLNVNDLSYEQLYSNGGFKKLSSYINYSGGYNQSYPSTDALGFSCSISYIESEKLMHYQYYFVETYLSNFTPFLCWSVTGEYDPSITDDYDLQYCITFYGSLDLTSSLKTHSSIFNHAEYISYNPFEHNIVVENDGETEVTCIYPDFDYFCCGIVLIDSQKNEHSVYIYSPDTPIFEIDEENCYITVSLTDGGYMYYDSLIYNRSDLLYTSTYLTTAQESFNKYYDSGSWFILTNKYTFTICYTDDYEECINYGSTSVNSYDTFDCTNNLRTLSWTTAIKTDSDIELFNNLVEYGGSYSVNGSISNFVIQTFGSDPATLAWLNDYTISSIVPTDFTYEYCVAQRSDGYLECNYYFSMYYISTVAEQLGSIGYVGYTTESIASAFLTHQQIAITNNDDDTDDDTYDVFCFCYGYLLNSSDFYSLIDVLEDCLAADFESNFSIYLPCYIRVVNYDTDGNLSPIYLCLDYQAYTENTEHYYVLGNYELFGGLKSVTTNFITGNLVNAMLDEDSTNASSLYNYGSEAAYESYKDAENNGTTGDYYNPDDLDIYNSQDGTSNGYNTYDTDYDETYLKEATGDSSAAWITTNTSTTTGTTLTDDLDFTDTDSLFSSLGNFWEWLATVFAVFPAWFWTIFALSATLIVILRIAGR